MTEAPTGLKRGALYGLVGAALFGASAPVAKLLLAGTGPLLLAGLLYLGGAFAVTSAQRLRPSQEPPLRRGDLPLLAGVVVAGGLAGPVLMLLGLMRVSGMAGALLLNLEAPLTLLLAVAFFGEHLGLRQGGSAMLILAGAAVLTLRPGEVRADGWGIAALAGACACWAVDNNLTQRLSAKDPLAIVRFKGLGAGVVNLGLGLALREPFPRPSALAMILVLGAASYGVSIVLDVLSLRHLGAAREAAFFATAPFWGALFAVPVLGERPRPVDGAAMALMALGVALLWRTSHSHRHRHLPLEHEHLHVHDEHHQHAHPGGVSEPHSHLHRHEPLTHDHPHASDEHHRHSH